MAKTMKVPSLTGARITKVRRMTETEVENRLGAPMNPYEVALALELDNGVTLCALRDPEGNGVGCLVGLIGGHDGPGAQFYVDQE